MSAISPIRIGVIGCGRILPAHLRGLRLLREAGVDDFRVTALVARTLDDARMFRLRGEGPPPRPPVSQNPRDSLAAPHCYVSDFQPDLDAQVFDSVEAMLAADLVDAVTITTTLGTHHTIGLVALEAGKHVMVEKPLAISVRAGRALVDAAERRARVLGVMEMVRYSEATRLMRWAIERGELGDPQMVASISISTPEWSPDKIVAETAWRHQRQFAGGGASIDLGVHVMHQLRYVVGELERVSAVARVIEPERVRRDANGAVVERVAADADDAFFALPEFESGAIGTLSFTWAGHGEPTALPGGLTIYGTRGCLKGTTLIRDDGTREELSDLFAREGSAAERERFFPHDLQDAFALTYLDWLRCIQHGGQPETSGLEGLRDLAAAFAIMESATVSGSVRVADVLDGTVAAYQRGVEGTGTGYPRTGDEQGTVG
jgi:1,5-anhydro-D-fructose reductase (1,5-anhydro-D-mannitol-forming)